MNRCVRLRCVGRLESPALSEAVRLVHEAAFAGRTGFSGHPGLFEADWQRVVEYEGYQLAVAEDGTELLGYAITERQSDRAAFPDCARLPAGMDHGWLGGRVLLAWLGVAARARGSGIGTALLQLALRGTSEAALYVDGDNVGAQRFYRAQGWVRAGEAGSQQIWIWRDRYATLNGRSMAGASGRETA